MTILLPVDGSLACERTLLWASRVLDKAETELVLLNVIFWSVDALVRDEEIRIAEKILNDSKTLLESQGFHKVDVQYIFGSPVPIICEFATDRHVDQIIIGSHGENALNEIIMGNVSHGVLKTAKQPVLLVNNKREAHGGPFLEMSHTDALHLVQKQDVPMKILLPVDGSQGAKKTLAWAAQFLDKQKSQVHLLYAAMLSVEAPMVEFQEEEGQRIVNEAKADMERLGFQVQKAEYVFDTPENGILKYADEHEIDEIIMGTHGFRGITKLLLGSVSESVFKHARQPVIIVNNTPEQSLKISRMNQVDLSIKSS